MLWVRLIQAAIVVAVVAGLTYLVIWSAEGWADWVVFGMILFATMGVILAYHHRRYPPATRKRSFTRDPDSRW